MNLKAIVAAIVTAIIVAAAIFSFLSATDENMETQANVTGSNGNIYTVNFNLNGGTGDAPSQKTIHRYPIILPTNVTKDGYVLMGWNENSNGSGTTKPPGTEHIVYGDTTLYAQWERKGEYYDNSAPAKVTAYSSYTYTPNVSGDIQKPGTSGLGHGDYTWAYLKKHSKPGSSTDLGKTEYKLTGPSWLSYSFSSSGNYISGITFSGTAEAPGLYHVQFTVTNTGTNRVSIDYDWYILVASELDGRYTVKFDNNGGSGGAINDAQYSNVPYNNVISLPNYSYKRTLANHTQVGWENRNGSVTWAFGAYYVVNGDTTLYASWEAGKNVLVIDATGAFIESGSAAFLTQSGEAVSLSQYDLSAAHKNGYVARGFQDPQNSNYIYNPHYNLPSSKISSMNVIKVYFVKEGASELTVTYDANGGTGRNQIHTLESGKYSITPSEIGYNKSGYNITGWNTKADGSGTAYGFGVPVQIRSNTTLYAQWEKTGGSEEPGTNYTVYFHSNGGSGSIPSQTVAAGGTATEPSRHPTKAGEIFAGWSLTGKSSQLFNFSTRITSNTTLYAAWNPHFTINVSDSIVTLIVADDFRGGNVRGHTVNWGDGTIESYGPAETISKTFSTTATGTVTLTTNYSDNSSVSSSRVYFVTPSTGEQVVAYFIALEGSSGYYEIVGIYAGTTITLPSAKDGNFQSDGLVLKGWESDDGTIYKPGDKYLVTENVTFYTVWSSESEANTTFAIIIAASSVAVISAIFALGKHRHKVLIITVLAAIIAIATAYIGGIL